MGRLALFVLVMHVTCSTVRADAQVRPPPDVTRGESYDGRTHGPDWRNDLLVVPRLILAGPRLLFDAIFWPIGKLERWTEKVHLVERVKSAILSEDGLVGVLPEFNFATGYRASGGLTYFNRRALGEATELRFTLSGNTQNILFARALMRPTRNDRAISYQLDTHYNQRDDYVFTGIGVAEARLRGASRYQVGELELRNDVRFIATRSLWFFLGGHFILRRFSNGVAAGDERPIAEVYCVRILQGRCVPGGPVDERAAPGFNQGVQELRLNATLQLDTRDLPQRPSSGALLKLSADYSHGIGADESSFFRFHASAQTAINLWRHSRVLLLRIMTDLVVPTNNVPVPFSELVVLGGAENLRGVRLGKYRDYSSVLVSAEYRWPIWMWMDAALFADYGGVFGRNYSGFALENLIPAIGVGLRLRTSSQFYLRAQTAYGFAGEGWQISISATTDPS